MFIARKSDHIQEDIKRNWSSWSFGQEGFNGTRAELDKYLMSATDSHAVFISGFEIYKDFVKQYEFGELYENYWVAIDRVNARNGLSCVELIAETLGEAIKEATSRDDYWGEGRSFDAREAKLVHSDGDIHIFEL